MTGIERTLEPLTAEELAAPTERDCSLAIVAAAVGDVLEARRRLRAAWDRHCREHGPETDPTALEAVRDALGRTS